MARFWEGVGRIWGDLFRALCTKTQWLAHVLENLTKNPKDGKQNPMDGKQNPKDGKPK